MLETMATLHAPTHTSRRLNHLAKAIGASTYIEIGVWKGDTFENVSVPTKVAIDPRPEYDWQSRVRDGMHFFKSTSDEFFSGNDCRGFLFDLAFIDGFHQFGQTLRDFLNVLTLSSSKAIWVIDDTYPNDFFSSLPDPTRTFAGRKKFGNTSTAWHGNTYKIVFAIHDLLPTLSYCTISTGGNPQTVVWRQPRNNFKPRFKSLEDIDRSDYYVFQDNLDLFNMKPEGDALQLAINGTI